MTTADIQAPLSIRQSPKRQLRPVAFFAAVLCAYLAGGAAGKIPGAIVWLGIAVFGSMLVIGLHAVLKARRASWELTLDQDGVTVRGHPRTPWTDLAEVRLVDARPRWMFVLTRRYQFIAFVGRPGVKVPGLPSARGGRGTSRFSRARQKMYGTDLVIPPEIFDASTDTVLRAVEHFGKLPITRA